MRRSKGESMDTGAVRNLEEIQEEDPGARPSRAGALVLASLGGACIVFAAVALLRAPHRERPVNADPLGDLVARAHPAGVKPAPRPATIGEDVTFPAVLSDAEHPTTALEAVRDPRAAKAAASAEAPAAAPAPPLAADRLPVVPLPAQHVLGPSGGEVAPNDTLTAMARHVSREEGPETERGGPGSYQLQVSSFKDPTDAENFAAALRRRGHKAYVEPAYVKGRGLWHRVRVGPFKYKRSAVIYRQEFEAKERLVTFIVDPPKTTVKVAESPGDDA
ncbi:SPOR domain-containing protein [Sorangium atrum]|uniref:SPOR domain-containing protein n=1 Tax=Sorangium atrum TaxID=2995308 RepID=A0ABT5C7U2_9BACT|nr:SPOR domain-containing protein [Sorangium aterium]MDC0681895.1 SPOR domain-containing protein [Sorangium aterium]